MRCDTYLQEVVRETPRLLGLLDRNVLSGHYGCFDRQHWHYAATEFSCARMQEAILTLALLYRTDRPDNPYSGRELLLDWINAAIGYWASIQNADGTFSEWYPGEKSFVATAFSTCAVAETMISMGDRVRDRAVPLAALRRAGDWLSRQSGPQVTNQMTGAAVALHAVYLLTGEERYRDAARAMIGRVLTAQTAEGWFDEYGGADVGYLSLSVHYLSRYYQMTGDRQVMEAAKMCNAFLVWFLHPDGTCGGDYGSRSTEYLIPSGFEALVALDGNAAIIAQFIRRALGRRTSISPGSLDDRYLAYIAYNWLQAYLCSGDLPAGHPPYEGSHVKRFPGAGIEVYSDEDFYIVMSAARGGRSRCSSRAAAGRSATRGSP